MANSFLRGATVICSIEVYDKNGVLTDPTTSMKIDIYDPVWVLKANKVDMVKDDPPVTGKYYYDFVTSATDSKGIYRVYYWATSGSRVSSSFDTMELT